MSLYETLKSNLETMTAFEYNKYLDEVENKYIKMNTHYKNDNLVIFNYTESVVFEKRWNKETMSARGLILDISDISKDIVYILAKPFDKFFNYGENLDYEADIDFNDISFIADKLDGSMGVSYFLDDEIHWATRGSFVSDQAKEAKRIWDEKYKQNFDIDSYVYNPFTMITEIIYPKNRIVVDYGDKEELVLLGLKNITTILYNVEYSIKMLKLLADELGMSYAKQITGKGITDLLRDKKTLTANTEGFIVVFGNGKRLKIKGDEYLKVHKIFYGMSDKAKFKSWVDNKTRDYIMSLPEEFREELEVFYSNLDSELNLIYMHLNKLLKTLLIELDNRKDFALKVNGFKDIGIFKNHSFIGVLFKGYDNGEVNKDIIKEIMYKDYKYYLGE